MDALVEKVARAIAPKLNQAMIDCEAGWADVAAVHLAEAALSIPEIAALYEALEGYRAAVSYISADSWDGCSDCIKILRLARSADYTWDWAGNPDRIAAELKALRERTGDQSTHPMQGL